MELEEVREMHRGLQLDGPGTSSVNLTHCQQLGLSPILNYKIDRECVQNVMVFSSVTWIMKVEN